jgi:Zn-finger nucleic acid-binding protein
MRRPQATPESRARAERIARSLAGLLDDVPVPARAASEPDDKRAAAAPRERAEGKPLGCPRCAGAMQAVGTNQGVEIDQCLECGAIWLDAGELEQILVATDTDGLAQAPTSVRALRERMQEVLPPQGPVQYRECPRCAQVMRRINFGTISGVIVDECVQHGALLDPGELQAIEAFIRMGGRSLGEQTRLDQGQRAMPPAPVPLRAPGEIRGNAKGSAADVLWDLLFHW